MPGGGSIRRSKQTFEAEVLDVRPEIAARISARLFTPRREKILDQTDRYGPGSIYRRTQRTKRMDTNVTTENHMRAEQCPIPGRKT